jgi:hypothetical protein
MYKLKQYKHTLFIFEILIFLGCTKSTITGSISPLSNQSNSGASNGQPVSGPSPSGTPTTPPSPTPSPTPITPLPYGGISGFTNLIYTDSFGSAKVGATITNVSQFNPSTSYGLNGTGWDRWEQNWGQSKSNAANIAMMSDHLEIYPTNAGSGQAGFIVSHFETLPTPGHPVYFEIRGVTGQGGFNANLKNSASTWPAFWLFAGNEPNDIDNQSELDIMETYMNLQGGQPVTDQPGPVTYNSYFMTTTHTAPNATEVETLYNSTGGIDITTTYNIYGCEVSTDSNRNISWIMYFNGAKSSNSTKLLQWTSSNPAILLGWNPGTSPYSNAVMMIDYVKVWSK